jgi:hypothetical protein
MWLERKVKGSMMVYRRARAEGVCTKKVLASMDNKGKMLPVRKSMSLEPKRPHNSHPESFSLYVLPFPLHLCRVESLVARVPVSAGFATCLP